LYHPNKVKNKPKLKDDLDDDHNDMVGHDDDHNDMVGHESPAVDPLSIYFTRNESTKYFRQRNMGRSGLSFLAARSTFKNELVSSELDDIDVELSYQLAKLCFSITRLERDNLAIIFRLICKKADSRQSEMNEKQSSTKQSGFRFSVVLPQTSHMLRSRFIHGRSAYVPNLPHPSIEMVGEYAYVPLHDCVADLLAHGVMIDPVTRPDMEGVVRRVGESPRCQEVAEHVSSLHGEVDFTLWITEWSDSFDPNNSTNNNRGSVHVKTITISCPQNIGNPRYSTYTVCIGHSKGDLSQVEDRFEKDLARFREPTKKMFYHGGLKRMVSVHVELIASVQDQPERRASNCLMLGSSRFFARWGYSIDLKSVQKLLPS
jgi:hypothetical protein